MRYREACSRPGKAKHATTRPPLCQHGDNVQSPMPLLTKYLDEIGAGPVVTTPDPEAAKSLPVFCQPNLRTPSSKSVWPGILAPTLSWQRTPHARRGREALEAVRSALGPNVVFIFLALPTFDRKRFIQRRIPFLVPGRQAYLPIALIDLREMAKGGQRLLDEPKERLSAQPRCSFSII